MRWKKWIHDPTKNFKKLHHKELAKVPSAWEGLGRTGKEYFRHKNDKLWQTDKWVSRVTKIYTHNKTILKYS